MTKTISIPFHLELTRYPGQSVLKIELINKALLDWCLGLCLLKEDLINVLHVRNENSRLKSAFKVSMEAKQEVQSHATFGAEQTRIVLTRSDLDYVIHFFLKYYRDGLAEVDHIDLEVLCDSEGQDSCITLKVSEFMPPLDSDEAERRLGLK
jgi:hypothetical protein